jgi:hypothetical protein
MLNSILAETDVPLGPYTAPDSALLWGVHGAVHTIMAVTPVANNPNADIMFDASRSVPTGQQNVPQHVMQPCILYLGRSA